MNNTILFTDDEKNILNSLFRVFRKEGYNILTADNGKDGLELVKANKVSVVVSDHRMPGMDGVEFLSKVKAFSPGTIRFMLTGYADIDAVMGAINKGEVYRYITKPWNDDELKRAVADAVDIYNLHEENRRLNELTVKQNSELQELNRNLEKKVDEKTRKIKENFFAFVRIVANLIELYDPDLGGHSRRVASMSRAMAFSMGIDGIDAELIETAALLHNIGLVGIPKEILEKDEEFLSGREKALFLHNPELSQDLLSSVDTLRQAGIIIRSHMERYDGKGYPDGLKNEEIHIGSRILAVCKRYDTLKNKKGLSLKDTIGEMRKEMGLSLDHALVDDFLRFLQNWRDESSQAGLTQDAGGSCTKLPLSELRQGMVLGKNLITVNGRLLVTKGTVLTKALIEKVTNFNEIDPIPEGVHISSSGKTRPDSPKEAKAQTQAFQSNGV